MIDLGLTTPLAQLTECQVAALQLGDRGLVSLDSPEDVEKHLPELSTLGVLLGYDVKGAPLVIPPEQKITLRMLLSHTAGRQTMVYITKPEEHCLTLLPQGSFTIGP